MSNLQSEITTGLKKALGDRHKKVRSLEVKGIDSKFWRNVRGNQIFGPWVIGPDTETDVVDCVKMRIKRL